MGILKCNTVSFCIALIFVIAGIGHIIGAELLSTPNNEVSITAYKTVKDSTRGSLVTSPFSTRVMMAMLFAGARENTRTQIQKIMKFPQSEADLFESYREYIQTLNSPSEFKTKTEIANRVFLKEGFLVQENFQNILKHHFQAPMQQISFQNPKKAAEEINSFISRKTGDRIQRVVDSSDLTNQTRMVLVNTLYFKGPWENPFPTASTRRMPFFLGSNGKTKTVDMMRVETYFRSKDFREYDCKAVVIPYQKNSKGEDGYQMVLLIPNKKDGLQNLEQNLDDFTDLNSLYDVPLRNIELRLPRFKIETTLDLVSPLKQMGITEVFDQSRSNLGGIPSLPRGKLTKNSTEDNVLFVSKVIQKAFLNVDEAGSEAGAATLSVVFVPLSIGPAVEEVITVDRPFFGFIRDARRDIVLFTFRKTD